MNPSRTGRRAEITGRKRTEDLFRKRFDMATEAANVGIWFCDLPFDKIVWDDRVKEHFWLPPGGGDVTFDIFYARLHPDDREPTRQAITRSVSNNVPYDVEYRTVAPDGREKWIHAVGRTFYDDAGNPKRFDGATVEITERKQVEEALRLSEERLRRTSAELALRVVQLQESNDDALNSRRAALKVMEDAVQARQLAETLNLQLRSEAAERAQAEEALRASEQRFHMVADNISQLAWTCDRLGNVTWYNQRWLEYTGMSFETMKGWDWSGVQHPNHLDRVVASIKRSAETGEPWEDTFPLRGKDGTYRWFLSRAVPIRDAEGKIVQWFGTNTDITEERNAEEELRQRAQLLEMAHEPIIVRDLEDNILYWNKGAERLYGWTTEEAVGKRIHDLLRTSFPESPNQASEHLRSHGYWEGELNQTARDGSAVVVITRWVLQKDGEGRPISILDTKFDITERKRSETALRTTEKLASVGRMAATLAHEVNNPLESVTNLIYLAQKESIPESVQNLLAAADEELGRIGHMTKQTLGLYRESATPQPVLVSGLLSGLLSMYSPKIKTRQIKTELKIISEVEVLGVRGELRQVLSNLLSNSIDAVGAHGSICLRVAETHAASDGSRGGVRVTIADNGSGIPAANLRKIFDPFFTTKQDVGTGLGLWVSKEIVKQHGGSIRFRSCVEPGKTWTVASVFLPASAPVKGGEHA